MIFYGACAGQEVFAGLVENLVALFRGVRGRLASSGLLGEDAFEATLEGLERWRGRADASLWYTIAWAEGVRP